MANDTDVADVPVEKDNLFAGHVAEIFSFLGNEYVDPGRTLRTVDLRIDGLTGDVDLKLIDDLPSDQEHIANVEIQNHENMILARRSSMQRLLREARKHVKSGKWVRALSDVEGVLNTAKRFGDSEFSHAIESMKLEILRFRERHLDVQSEQLCSKVRLLTERFDGQPQTIFFIEKDGVTYVGRKLLSQRWVSGEISELFCSAVSPEMVLGRRVSSRICEDRVMVYYEPIARDSIEEDLFSNFDSSMELRYPYPYLSKTSHTELVSPETGWEYESQLHDQLKRGESFLRRYSQEILRDLLPANPVMYDPACSTGDFLAEVASIFENPYTVGQDLSYEMAEVAASKLDEIYHGDAISSPVSPASVDVVFLRFLNSEVVNTIRAMELFDSIIERVRVGGYLVLFGHTPVLLDEGFLRTHDLEIQSCVGRNELNSIFQFYLLKKT
jgi:isonocardicin synthase